MKSPQTKIRGTVQFANILLKVIFLQTFRTLISAFTSSNIFSGTNEQTHAHAHTHTTGVAKGGGFWGFKPPPRNKQNITVRT